MKMQVARSIYGLSAIAFGICGLIWHDVAALSSISHHANLALVVSAFEVLGGAAILFPFPRTLRAGCLTLCLLYVAFALVALPGILHQPRIYNNWGNFFEQLSLAPGAIILFANATLRPMLARAGYYIFGICVVSFTLEQCFYLHETAALVPHWIPPSPMFWAIATTVCFGLAAIALLSGILARLAAQLTAAMLIGFALLSWAPILQSDPHTFFNWSETAETIAIAACAWVIAEHLYSSREKLWW